MMDTVIHHVRPVASSADPFCAGRPFTFSLADANEILTQIATDDLISFMDQHIWKKRR